MTVYDPPSGWRYGFPKPYLPLADETLEQTLLRDGYPQKEIDGGMAKYVRFWEHLERKPICETCWNKKCFWRIPYRGTGDASFDPLPCHLCGEMTRNGVLADIDVIIDPKE